MCYEGGDFTNWVDGLDSRVLKPGVVDRNIARDTFLDQGYSNFTGIRTRSRYHKFHIELFKAL